MTADDNAQALYLLLMLMLVASALFARRLPMAQVARMALGWAAIFLFLFALYAFRDDFTTLWSRLSGAADPQSGIVENNTLRIPMGDDGHFRVRASVNGSSARFLIDSGATTTALSNATARSAGIELDDGSFGVAINTANGTVIARRIRIERLEVGPVVRTDLAAVSAEEFGDTNVLGMNFLSSLRRWGVEGRTLVLVP